MTAEEQDMLRAYRLCFGSREGQAVLHDLMKFCCFRRETANLIDEGKRQAFLRIVNFAKLTDDQIIRLYTGQQVNIGETE